MAYDKILVLYKKSTYEIYKEKADIDATKKWIDTSTASGQRLLESHEANKKMLDAVIKTLIKQGIEFKTVWRGELSRELVQEYPVIMTVGGDGTVLTAAKYHNCPLLIGVNSNWVNNAKGKVRGSEGFYTCIDQNNFDEMIYKFLEGKLQPVPLMRLKASMDGKNIERLVLNEVSIKPLIKGHSGIRLTIRAQDFEEELPPSCDGYLISTPHANWGLAYGGEVLDIEGKEFQGIAMGLNAGRRAPDPTNVIITDKFIEVLSRKRGSTIAINGDYELIPFELGSVLHVENSNNPLQVIGFDIEKAYNFYVKKRKPKIARI